jgi:hypothetical protein
MHSRVTIAIQNANGWTANAEAVIKAYLRIDQEHAALTSALYRARDPRNAQMTRTGTLEEAERLLSKTVEKLGEIIDATRAEFIADEYFYTDTGASAETEDRNEADNKAVEEGVTSVKAAENAVRFRHYDIQ